MKIPSNKSFKTHFILALIFSILCSERIAWSTGVEKCNHYRTYLVNSTNSWVEYTIESIDTGAIVNAGLLPPAKSLITELEASDKQRDLWKNGLSWVLKLDLPLGSYKICLKFPQQIEKCYTKILEKSDYTDSLIPYWEIESE